ncbi:MAG TPA: alpha/beta hydrolase, partial [Chitinophagales bacterium]|nr:alpha/beta hydrolase [Chitinophagales bacterium]
MKTKIYLLAFTLSALVFVQRTEAQGVLYKDMVFSSVDFTSDVVYSTSNSTTLAMDIYQPHGDTSSMRPVLIMAHGGSFISGDRTNDNVCTQLCDSFARRGYVCASIDYRLGNALQMIDSAQAITVVMKAISDGKSAVRFFRKDAATTNTYRINPDLIFVGGNSAGAVLYMHQIYIDSLNECPPNLRNIINANGGLEGNSGNDGYCSYSTAVLNLAGGLNVPEFVGPGNKPSFNAQGDQDATVPYNCADAQSGFTPVRLCGLGAI